MSLFPQLARFIFFALINNNNNKNKQTNMSDACVWVQVQLLWFWDMQLYALFSLFFVGHFWPEIETNLHNKHFEG